MVRFSAVHSIRIMIIKRYISSTHNGLLSNIIITEIFGFIGLALMDLVRRREASTDVEGKKIMLWLNKKVASLLRMAVDAYECAASMEERKDIELRLAGTCPFY